MKYLKKNVNKKKKNFVFWFVLDIFGLILRIYVLCKKEKKIRKKNISY